MLQNLNNENLKVFADALTESPITVTEYPHLQFLTRYSLLHTLLSGQFPVRYSEKLILEFPGNRTGHPIANRLFVNLHHRNDFTSGTCNKTFFKIRFLSVLIGLSTILMPISLQILITTFLVIPGRIRFESGCVYTIPFMTAMILECVASVINAVPDQKTFSCILFHCFLKQECIGKQGNGFDITSEPAYILTGNYPNAVLHFIRITR